jgi:hypothetical protein
MITCLMPPLLLLLLLLSVGLGPSAGKVQRIGLMSYNSAEVHDSVLS